MTPIADRWDLGMRLSCDCSGQLPDVEPEEGFLCIVQNNVLFAGILLLHKRMLYTNPATSPNQKFALGQAQIRMVGKETSFLQCGRYPSPV